MLKTHDEKTEGVPVLLVESIQVQDTLELTPGQPQMFKRVPREINFTLVPYKV